MILLLLSFLRTAALSRPASFFCEPPRSVGPLPYYRYILSTGLPDDCERLHNVGVISTTFSSATQINPPRLGTTLFPYTTLLRSRYNRNTSRACQWWSPAYSHRT